MWWTELTCLPTEPGIKILAVIPHGDTRKFGAIQERFSRLGKSWNTSRVAPQLTAFVESLASTLDPSTAPRGPCSGDIEDLLTELAAELRRERLGASWRQMARRTSTIEPGGGPDPRGGRVSTSSCCPAMSA
jgi:hypothetical protein